MRSPENLLPVSFYSRSDVTLVSRELLGKRLCTLIDGHFTSGIIIETEAYCGRGDKACHANNGKRTPRTEVMFGKPGHAYIYLCYGIHHLFNVVTNREGLADAVLVRAVLPESGVERMQQRRGGTTFKNLTSGPGKFTQALGITTHFNKTSLFTKPVWIEDTPLMISPSDIARSKRIGIDYAEEDAHRPWRYTIDPASLKEEEEEEE
ncbi:DNA-3-methyladenine glycosylase [Rhodohalobacter mucosus]|uniref:Putative 3-methyladenine DNA glycosylase n=1 Tax=Rhodohalobacter mucosus TaxID=2079485 RepID=A0A316TPB0_9BACT|nr:DNA-3-methyladenine glycosylase [Rhodohalobacter mucosus]PWN05648.1 DNA-3-methyladenine glycosylase [Rhodohalobacter mucosus]